MLNTKKLIYILPDVAYIADLLPGKKDHTFVIQAFRQINGDFMNEDEFIVENVEKLIAKIEPDEYHLILPDFLFTNTILEVAEIGESKVKNHVADKILPSLDLDNSKYQIEIFPLTEHQNKTKVQLSALENSLISPISQAAKARGVKILGITPLSWSIKSVVSLEPSITLIQIGSYLYSAQHYIGIDLTSQAKVDDVEAISETIKTLKGAEPSLQTVYLLTNELVAEQLKQFVSSTLPLQQLASFKEEETQMPSYIKQTIEAGMKTLDIPEYHAPSFESKIVAGLLPTPTTSAEKKLDEASDEPKSNALAKPSDDPDDDNDEETIEEVSKPISPASKLTEPDLTETDLELPPPAAPNLPAPSLAVLPEPVTEVALTTVSVKTESLSDSPKKSADPNKPTESSLTEEPDISQFAAHAELKIESTAAPEASALKPESVTTTSVTLTSDLPMTSNQPLPPKKVIKNHSGLNSFLKMVGLTLVVFIITVAVGVGLGLGFLKFTSRTMSENKSATPSPSAQAAATPVVVASPSPTASPAGQIDVAKTKLLVVNATTTAGYAGKTKKQLETAGFKGVAASNAKGEYEKGTYVLMKAKNDALIATLEKATELKLTYKNTSSVEDPKGEYDAVIVLGE